MGLAELSGGATETGVTAVLRGTPSSAMQMENGRGTPKVGCGNLPRGKSLPQPCDQPFVFSKTPLTITAQPTLRQAISASVPFLRQPMHELIARTESIESAVIVSFDIVGHGAVETSLQERRLIALNEVVARVLDGTRGIWASGGDGGHLALIAPAPSVFVDLLKRLTDWREQHHLSLRLSLHEGPIRVFPGADGRLQMVGPTINTAGTLVAACPADAIVATWQFRAWSTDRGIQDLRYAEWPRLLYPKYQQTPIALHLVSHENEVVPSWDTIALDDHQLLLREIELANGQAPEHWWRVIHRAKRLLQTDTRDPRATTALRNQLPPGQLLMRSESGRCEASPLFSQLSRQALVELLLSAELVERDGSQIVVHSGDEGDRMFVVLDGHVGVITASQLQQTASDSNRVRSIVVSPGEMVGELSMALGRPRTATIQAIGPTALLAIDYRRVHAVLDAQGQAVLDRLVMTKTLEHICSHVSYLGIADARPYISVERPWDLLAKHGTLVSRRALPGTVLDADDQLFQKDGLLILVSGLLRAADAGIGEKQTLDGSQFPLVSVRLPGQLCTPTRGWVAVSDDRLPEVRFVQLSAEWQDDFSGSELEAMLDEMKCVLAAQRYYDVFISYAASDLKEALYWCQQLEREGFTVYLNTNHWPAGTNPQRSFIREIASSISDARVMVVLASKDSAGSGSKRTWVQREVTYRLAIYADQPNVIPIEHDRGTAARIADGFPPVQVGPRGSLTPDLVLKRVREIVDAPHLHPFSRKVSEAPL